MAKNVKRGGKSSGSAKPDASKAEAVMHLSDLSAAHIQSDLQLLAAVVQHSSELINVATPDGKMVFLNNAGCKMLGIDPDKVEQFNILDVIPDYLKEKAKSEFLVTLAKQGTWEGDLQYRNLKTGLITDVHAMTFLIKNDLTGAPLYLANVSLDITERKKAEIALIESEERFRRLSENAPDVIYRYRIKPSPAFEYVSPAVLKMAGYAPEEFYANHLLARDMVHPQDRSKYQRHFSGPESLRTLIQLRWIHKEGHVVWAEEIDSPVYDNQGELIAYEGIVRDITDRKKAEEALSERETQYRLLSEHVKDTVWLMDMDLKTTYQSPSVQHTRGFTPQEIMEMPLEKHLTPESLKIASQIFLEEMTKLEADPDYNVSRTVDLEFYRKDGSTFWSENTFTVLRDSSGKPASILGEGRDITERRQAEATLRNSEAQYRLLAEHMTDTVWLMDMNFKPQYLSPSIEKVRGFTPQEIMEMPFEQNLTPASLKAANEVFLKELALVESDPNYNPVITLELEYYCKDGTTKWAENRFSLIRDQHGKPASILGEGRDISKRKKVEQALKESEELYRLLAEHVTDAVWLLDFNLNITYVSPSAEKLTGLTHKEIMEMPLEKFVTPESYKLAYAAFLEETKKLEADPGYNPVLALELEYYRRDGTTAWVENKFSLIRDSSRKPISILGEARDITERKIIEEALINSEALYRLVSEHTTDFVWLMDMDLRPTYQSPSAEKLTGFTQMELIELPFEKRVTPESLKLAGEVFLTEIPRVITDSKYNPVITLELEVYRKDGTTLWTENKFSIIRDNDGKPVSILGEARDVTGRKQAEMALHESEERWKFALEGAGDGLWDWNIETNRVFYSHQWKAMLGYTDDEVGDTFEEWDWRIHPEDHETVYSELARHYAGETPFFMFEQRLLCKDGTYKWILDRGKIIKWSPDGKYLRVIGTHSDISERKQVEEALRSSEDKYRKVVENAREAITIAVEGVFKFINRRTSEITGYSPEELMSKPFIEFIHPDDRQEAAERYNRRLAGLEVPDKFIFRTVFKAGDIRWIELSAVPITWEGKQATLSFMTDITDRKRMEEEQQRVAKLESLGVLAGGIAHDFNNILTSILGDVSLAAIETHAGTAIHDRLEEVQRAVLRAKGLTAQLLTFSRGGAPVKQLAPLNPLLKDTVVFALAGSNVKCNFNIPEDLWHAEFDPGQVSQVMHNLVINAQQAMPAGGIIEMTAENMIITGSQSLGKGLPLVEGKYIRIAVKDRGSGIPAEHLDRIFDPFFTTKQKGSGLGLATSFSIARNHGGHLSVESNLGQGSTFYFYLPASMAESVPGQELKKVPRVANKSRILLMDDEESVRKIAERLLKYIGYENMEFTADGAEAINIYETARQSGRPFDLVILDLTVPGGMGGEEAIKKLLEINPGVKAIVSSGYSNEAIMANYKEYGFSGAVAKPYTLEELGQVLQDVLS